MVCRLLSFVILFVNTVLETTINRYSSCSHSQLELRSYCSVTGNGNSLQTSSPGLSSGSSFNLLYLRISIHLCPSKYNEYLRSYNISSINASFVCTPL